MDRSKTLFVALSFATLALYPAVAGSFGIDLVTKTMIFAVFALSLELLVGMIDTFGVVLLPQAAGVLVYVLMALILLWKPNGLFRAA